MNNQDIQTVAIAFNSILRSDYISLDDINQLELLDKYYVDYFNNISCLLQKQDNYLCGRRGTGKTTLLYRSYLECLKTISPKIANKKSIFGEQKILPIFIDLSKCSDMFGNDDPNIIERHFVREIISNLRSQLDNIFDEKHLLIFKKENPALDDLEYIETLLTEGKVIGYSQENKNVTLTKNSDSTSSGLSLSGKGLKVSLETDQSEKTETSIESTSKRGLNVNEFLNKINIIRQKAGIDSIYIFIDEFSDLNSSQQKSFSHLLKTLLGSKVNIFYKLGVITDRFYFGENIRLGRDIFPVNLDLNEYVERYDGTVATIKKMQDFVKQLVDLRLKVFCSQLKIKDIFRGNLNEIFFRISRESLGVSRTIGLILQNAWTQAQIKDDKKIGLQEVNFGIRSTRKTYFKQFQGAIKNRLLPGYYMDIWSSILSKAISEKNKYPDRPASHLLVDPIRKDYLNILCENFLIHFLEEGRSSKYGGYYNLYCIDYDVCMDNNIKFAKVKDEFTAARFVYDNVLSEYDPYFMNDKIKSYKCPHCGTIYDEKDVMHITVKRCFTDDTLLEEIIHKETPKTDGNYAEVEIKILGLISTLETETEAESAQQIADEVGCSVQKVALWCSRVLYKNKLINITKRYGKNFYYSINNS